MTEEQWELGSKQYIQRARWLAIGSTIYLLLFASTWTHLLLRRSVDISGDHASLLLTIGLATSVSVALSLRSIVGAAGWLHGGPADDEDMESQGHGLSGESLRGRAKFLINMGVVLNAVLLLLMTVAFVIHGVRGPEHDLPPMATGVTMVLSAAAILIPALLFDAASKDPLLVWAGGERKTSGWLRRLVVPGVIALVSLGGGGLVGFAAGFGQDEQLVNAAESVMREQELAAQAQNAAAQQAIAKLDNFGDELIAARREIEGKADSSQVRELSLVLSRLEAKIDMIAQRVP